MTQPINIFTQPTPKRFPAYSSVGGYPLFYLDLEYNLYCPDCAEAAEDEDGVVPTGHPNWEDPCLYCDCGTRIESAYAEKEEE